MIDRCASCPGDRSLNDFLNELTAEENEKITFKKWTLRDRIKLETITEDKEKFIESLVKLISNLTKHHYVVRCQGANFSHCKSELESDSVIFLKTCTKLRTRVLLDD